LQVSGWSPAAPSGCLPEQIQRYNSKPVSSYTGGIVKLGFLFPGQGSQAVGMLGEVAAAHPIIEATFHEASEVLDLPLWALACDGPEEKLNQTEITQPILLTASVALWRAWLAAGGAEPGIMAGHSLGEYSALVCAGAMSFSEGVALVRRRGALMQQAVPQGEGAMAAILGLEDDQIDACCAQIDGVVSPANFNAPGQVVIAGSALAVEEAVALCTEAGARRAVMLKVSGPFHCELMMPAVEGFAAALDQVDLQMPTIPVVHNVDARVATSVDELREKLLAQMAQPVRWSSCVEEMVRHGAESFVECGSGKVLAGLIKRIDRGRSVFNLETESGFNDGLASSSGEAS
jgi:[acyl-carrier-protein] S-malonyltransferase